MKKAVLLSFLLFQFVCKSQEVLENCQVINSSNYINQGGYDTVEMSKLQMIFSMDVYNYFELTGQYDSELKKKHFESTEQYSEYFGMLEYERELVKENCYRLKGSDIHEITGFSSRGINSLLGNDGYEINYDTKMKGFFIPVGDVSYLGCSKFISNTIADFEFSTMPITKKWNKYKDGFEELLFIPVSEDIALEIENDRDNIDLLLKFKVTGIDYRNTPNQINKCKPQQVFTTKNLRIVVFNKASGKKYYDVAY